MNSGVQSVPEVPPDEALVDRYLHSQIEWPKGSNQYFVPVDFFSLIDPVTVERELGRLGPQIALDGNYVHYVDWISKNSQRLFVLLICGMHLEWKHAIPGLVDDKITDYDLPFGRGHYDTSGKTQYVLCKKDHNGCLKTDHYDCGIKALSKWDFRTIKDFDRAQWSILAPEFRKVRGNVPSCPHKDLVMNIIMPFIEDNPAESVRGGFGEVWMIRMHKAHHDLCTSDDEKGPVFAVKRLFTSDEKEFKQECEFVQAMTSDEKRRHPHLMPLLATYKYNEKFHLIFPFAEANLRNYWKSVSMPSWDEATCLWTLRQVHGLVSGLKAIHLFETQNLTYEAGEVEISRLSTSLRRARINPTVVEKKYGRHGDLKPENILYLQNGTLQIADFGLGRFHRLESRSRVEPRHINGSPTYSPPEMVLDGGLISRAYDIWSLGCILLEFITWLLEGSAGLDGFNSSRTAKAHDGIDDDLYYSIEVDEGGRGVGGHVRKGVVDWIKRLRSLSRHSDMVLDFLDTIEKDMLVIDANKRISAEGLERRMEHILSKGTRNSGYLLGTIANVED